MTGLYNLDAKFVTEDPDGDILGAFSMKPLVSDPELIDLALSSAQILVSRRKRPLNPVVDEISLLYESLQETAVRCASLMPCNSFQGPRRSPLISYSYKLSNLWDENYFDPRYLATQLCEAHSYIYWRGCSDDPFLKWPNEWKEYWKDFNRTDFDRAFYRRRHLYKLEDGWSISDIDQMFARDEQGTHNMLLNTKNPFTYTYAKSLEGRI